jgi:adenylate kinase family enzyme
VRLLLTGWPNSGKTTAANALSKKLHAPVRSTDNLIGLGWSEASEAAATSFALRGPWIVEGVAVPRAVRKWLGANPDASPPWERFVVLTDSFEELTPGQVRMGRGIDTVLAGLGVPIEYRSVEELLASIAIAAP